MNKQLLNVSVKTGHPERAFEILLKTYSCRTTVNFRQILIEDVGIEYGLFIILHLMKY